MLEAAVKPTQQRVLEISGTLYDLDERFIQQEQRVREWGKEMQEHLGFGNGTLKQQIMADVTEAQRAAQREVKHSTALVEKYTARQESRITTIENRLKVWLHVQTEGAATLKQLEEQLQKHETRTSEAIRRNVEHGGAMATKLV
jgi:uncharacterized protein with von Willebrand factor type A (vWA) domain